MGISMQKVRARSTKQLRADIAKLHNALEFNAAARMLSEDVLKKARAEPVVDLSVIAEGNRQLTALAADRAVADELLAALELVLGDREAIKQKGMQ